MVVPEALHAHLSSLPGPRYRSTDGKAIAAALAYMRSQFTKYGCLLGSRRWEATIELVAFDFEENVLSFRPPHSLASSGSRRYVASVRDGRRNLRGAFVLEMIGYRNPGPGSQTFPEDFGLIFPALARWLEARQRRADFIVALGDADSPLLGHVQRACEEVGGGLPLLSVPVPAGTVLRDLLRSDHVPFWEAGLPAVMLTDTADFRNPHYHKPSDLPETLDVGFWRDVVTATHAAVAAVARPA